MSDNFFTVMIVPEKSDRVRKITLPSIYLRILVVVLVLLSFLGVFIFFDYLHILGQVAENKKLRVENNTLRSDVQSAQKKLETLDQSVGRLKSFAHKLQLIGNINNPESTKLLRAPENNNNQGNPLSEDSGDIEDPDKKGERPKEPLSALPKDIHGLLEYQRSLTVLGNSGGEFASQSLGEQITYVSEAATKLTKVSELEEQTFAKLQELYQDRVDHLLSTPSIVPVVSRVPSQVSSEFGYRYNPISGVKTFHAGLDIANHTGTPVVAPADGLITFVGPQGAFGLIVRIDHGYSVVTKYGHNSKIVVKKGQRVKRGELIAHMGSSGRSTGPHLHYQVEINGRPVNPRFFILEDTF